MAIYHLSVKIHSRSAGMSAVAGAAYRAGQALEDERTGEAHDYTRRGAVDHTEILAPDDAPSWTQDRCRLWNEVEAAETRSNSRVAREIVVALPQELAADERRELVRSFVSEQCVSRGMVADVAYHDGESRNPHAHVLLTTRRIGPDGFAGKDRAWNDRAVLQEWRQEWAAATNRALERAQRPERVDHRTLVDQRQAALDRGDQEAAAQLNRPAGVHLGRARHQEIRTRRPAERVTRAIEAQPDRPQSSSLLDQMKEQERSLDRERPPLAPSGLERVSSDDREHRQTIERVVVAIRECIQKLRDEIRLGFRDLAEAQRRREAEQRQREERQREREWARTLERLRDDRSFDRSR
ncbi:MAG: MobA/MobL family protein [Acidobacteria bacterium]|nr:MobA/MobL family protein [Acidobacteriota bacterium]